MNSYINKKTVSAFIFGIIVVLFCYHAYLVYQIRATVIQHDVLLGQIVSLIEGPQATGTTSATE